MPFIHKKQNIQDVRKSINTNYELHLKILTPLHVGGASEKHWKEDVDFWYEDNSVHEINQEKLFDAAIVALKV